MGSKLWREAGSRNHIENSFITYICTDRSSSTAFRNFSLTQKEKICEFQSKTCFVPVHKQVHFNFMPPLIS